jgi:hypothetical protein
VLEISGPVLLRFGPALIILLAAVIYAGAVAWQHQGSPHVPTMNSSNKAADFDSSTARPPKTACDALWHYTPSISTPVGGRVMGVKNAMLKLKNSEGVRDIVLVSTTQIVGLGKRKPPQVAMADMKAFKELAKPCNDGTRVYLAPDDHEEINLTPANLKPEMIVQVLMDETDISKNQAADIMLMQPLTP